MLKIEIYINGHLNNLTFKMKLSKTLCMMKLTRFFVDFYHKNNKIRRFKKFKRPLTAYMLKNPLVGAA